MKKKFVILMILLFCSTLVQGAGSTIFTSQISSGSEKSANEGLPDLVIEGLGTKPSTMPYEYIVFCRFKNIGSGVAYDFIDLRVEVKRVFLGLFLINKTIYSTFANTRRVGGYAPGETGTIEFDYTSYLPAWGFFRIYCYINPNKRIEEENYDNNLYIRDVFVFFGDWVKAIG